MTMGFEVMAEGLFFPEGPVALADGSVLVVEIGACQITRVAADGATRTVFAPIWTANGVGLSSDESRLYVSDTETGPCYAFMIEEPGRIRPPAPNRPWEVMLPRPPGQARYAPLAVEAKGNICIGSLTPGGITVVSPQGELVDWIGLPDAFVTNTCFGGADMRLAYVALSGCVGRARVLR